MPPAYETGFVKANAVNIAIVMLDYETRAFQGAHVLYYAPCNPCADDSIPLSAKYNPPGDFGDITFRYIPTGDIVFAATIIWMGTGRIEFPQSFAPSDHFGRSDGVVPPPQNVRFFRYPGPADFPLDAIWAEIGSLDLVREFQGPDLRVGLYLYPPKTGLFDPRAAKWIVFLYRRT